MFMGMSVEVKFGSEGKTESKVKRFWDGMGRTCVGLYWEGMKIRDIERGSSIFGIGKGCEEEKWQNFSHLKQRISSASAKRTCKEAGDSCTW